MAIVSERYFIRNYIISARRRVEAKIAIGVIGWFVVAFAPRLDAMEMSGLVALSLWAASWARWAKLDEVFWSFNHLCNGVEDCIL
jgi:hypothetical protein